MHDRGSMGSCGELGRVPVALGMTARILAGGAIATVAVVAALTAGWYTVGPPATGTLSEAVVLAVAPPAAGLAALVSAPRKGRGAAAAFPALAFALSVITVVAVRAL